MADTSGNKNKNYTEVVIEGKTYTLGGDEDEEYLQRVAAYLNTKLIKIRKSEGFNRQTDDFKQILIYLNLADDYFKLRDRNRELEERNKELEKEVYNLKHELVSGKLGY